MLVKDGTLQTICTDNPGTGKQDDNTTDSWFKVCIIKAAQELERFIQLYTRTPTHPLHFLKTFAAVIFPSVAMRLFLLNSKLKTQVYPVPVASQAQVNRSPGIYFRPPKRVIRQHEI